jgi:dephospho-CoA kinase
MALRRPFVVGLTGGIASGKSTVAEHFAALGVPIVDADVAARRVVEPGSLGLKKVVDRFGPGVQNERGELDRGKLRERIFKDPAERRALEHILHPLIRAAMNAEAAQAKTPYIIMAVPLLIESGAAHERVDRVLVVDVPEEVQIARILERDKVPLEQARAILAAQAPRADRLAVADDVLTNTESLQELKLAVDRLHSQYLQSAETASR